MECKCPLLIKESTFEKARKAIRSKRKENPEAEIRFLSDNDDLNRKILEKEQISTLVLQQFKRKDFQKQRNSGLNQVLVKLAKKNKIKIGICLDEILKATPKDKSNILARVRQNIKLCNKGKVNMVFCGASVKDKSQQDIKSLGLILGMPTWMTKNLF